MQGVENDTMYCFFLNTITGAVDIRVTVACGFQAKRHPLNVLRSRECVLSLTKMAIGFPTLN